MIISLIQLVLANEIDNDENVFKNLHLIKNEENQQNETSYNIYNHITYNVEILDNNLTKLKQSQPSIKINNEKTIQLSEIPEQFGVAAESPDGSYFIGYNYTEIGIKNIYFYQQNGVLINSYSFSKSRDFKLNFSSEGSHVSIFNLFGDEFFVFNKLVT